MHYTIQTFHASPSSKHLRLDTYPDAMSGGLPSIVECSASHFVTSIWK